MRKLALALLCLLALPTLAVALQDSGSPGGKPRLVSPQAQADMEREFKRQARVDQQRREKRATPQAKARRQRSRSAFKDLSRSGALHVARDKFRSVMQSPMWEPAMLDRGEHVKRVIGQHG